MTTAEAPIKIGPDPVGDVSRDLDLTNYSFVPWPGRILVKRFDPDRLTRGGLELPVSAQAKKNWGVVVKLPESRAPVGVQVDDIVLFMDSGLDLDETLGEGHVLLDCFDEGDSDILGLFRANSSGTLTSLLDDVGLDGNNQSDG